MPTLQPIVRLYLETHLREPAVKRHRIANSVTRFVQPGAGHFRGLNYEATCRRGVTAPGSGPESSESFSAVLVLVPNSCCIKTKSNRQVCNLKLQTGNRSTSAVPCEKR